MKIKNAFQIGLLGGLGVLLALVIGTALGQIQTILVYAFAAMFLALGVEPVVQFLIRRGFPRWAALLTITVLLLGALTLAGLIIIPIVVEQFRVLIDGIIANINDGALENAIEWIDTTFPFINVRELIDFGLKSVQDPNTWAGLPPWLANVVQGMFGAVGQVVLIVGGVFIVVVLMLYFIGTLPQIKQGMYRLVPASKRPKFIEIAEQIMSSVGSFVVGQFTLGLTNGILSFIMLSIVGTDLAAVYAFMAFCASTIPLVGTITASVVITGLVALLDDPRKALIVGIYYLIYMQLEAYGISPMIMRRAVHVPGVVVVLAALIGGTLLGILGALVAVPVAAAIQLIIREVWIPRQELR